MEILRSGWKPEEVAAEISEVYLFMVITINLFQEDPRPEALESTS